MQNLLPLLALIATTSSETHDGNGGTNLENAMTGFDPYFLNVLQQPDRGQRSIIFQPRSSRTSTLGKEIVLNSFVNVLDESQCTPSFEVQTISNFDQYRILAAASLYELSTSSPLQKNCDTPFLRYDINDSCEKQNKGIDLAMHQFFSKTGGEALFVTTGCTTHTITLSPYLSPSFTPAFKEALKSLYEGAVNTNLNSLDSSFLEFVKSYGTHFSEQTKLGAKIVLVKLFRRKSFTVREAEARRQCVIEAANEALTLGARHSNETIHRQFSRASIEKCGGELDEVFASLIGAMPGGRLRDWASKAKVSPKPIYLKLQPMSEMFSKDWFISFFRETYQGPDGRKRNGTLLHQYFADKSYLYSERMLFPDPNSEGRKGCNSFNTCHNGTRCVDQPDSESGYICVSERATDPHDCGVIPGVPTPRKEDWCLPRPVSDCFTNVALGKKVTASSIYNAHNYPGRITDGVIDKPNDLFLSKHERNAWVLVDLQDDHLILGIRILPRLAYLGHRFLQISIRVGVEPLPGPDFSSYTEIVLIPGPPTNPVTMVEFFLETPICGRFISVQRTIPNNEHHEITELEVLTGPA